jgi:hypothetical protein
MSFHQGVEPCGEAFGTGYDQRPCPAAHQLCIENEGWKPAEMVGMQMRKQNCRDLIWLDAEPPDRNHCGCAAIDEEAIVTAIDEKAGIQTSARPKRITASKDF